MIKKIKLGYHHHKETIINSFWRFSQISSKMGTSFIIFYISSLYLTPKDFGLLNYFMALMGLLYIFCDFGFTAATSKYTSEMKSMKSKNLHKLLSSSFIIVIAFAAIVSLAVMLFGRFFISDYSLFVYLIPYLFLVPLTSLLDGYYRGLKKFKKLSQITILASLASLPIAFLVIGKYLLIGAIISQSTQYLILLGSLLIANKDLSLSFSKNIFKKISRYALVIGFANLAFFLVTKIDIIILQHYHYTVEIGYYEIVNKFFEALIFPAIILGQVIAPNNTKYYSRKKFKKIFSKFKMNSFFIIWIGLTTAIILYFTLPFLIETLFTKYNKPELKMMMNIMIIILPGRIIAAYMINAFVTPTGHARLLTTVNILFGFLNIVLDIVLINYFGFMGVIYATLILSYVTLGILIFRYTLILKKKTYEKSSRP